MWLPATARIDACRSILGREVLLWGQAKPLKAFPRVVLLIATLVGAGERRLADQEATSRPDVLRRCGPGLASIARQLLVLLHGDRDGDAPALQREGRAARGRRAASHLGAASQPSRPAAGGPHIRRDGEAGLPCPRVEVQPLRAVDLDRYRASLRRYHINLLHQRATSSGSIESLRPI